MIIIIIANHLYHTYSTNVFPRLSVIKVTTRKHWYYTTLHRVVIIYKTLQHNHNNNKQIVNTSYYYLHIMRIRIHNQTPTMYTNVLRNEQGAK